MLLWGSECLFIHQKKIALKIDGGSSQLLSVIAWWKDSRAQRYEHQEVSKTELLIPDLLLDGTVILGNCLNLLDMFLLSKKNLVPGFHYL